MVAGSSVKGVSGAVRVHRLGGVALAAAELMGWMRLPEGASTPSVQVLCVRFEQAIRWLTEHFGLVRVQAKIATVAELDVPMLGGDAPRRPGL